MAGFPQDFIDTIRARADVVDVVSRRVKLRKAGKDYVGLCPFHEEKTPSFTVSQAKQFYHCFGCGAHGDSIGFLMERDGMSFVDAIECLAGEIGLPVPSMSEPSAEDKQRRDRDVRLLEIMERAQRHFYAALRETPSAVEYAKSRGLTGETAKTFGIGYAIGEIASALPDVASKDLVEAGLLGVHEDSGEIYDKFRQRLMFPIHDERGRVIGFGGRVIGDAKPKYLNSPETPIFHKGRELYGLFQAKQAIRQERSAVLLEGYMDVVMLHQHGEPRAVAALGTSLTEDQVKRLFRMADEIIFCFDGDKAGQAAAARAVKIVLPELTDGKSARFVVLPAEHDPDSFVREHGIAAWRALLEDGAPLSKCVTEQLLAKWSGASAATLSPEERTAIAVEASEYLDLIARAPTFKEALTRHIETLLGFELPRTAKKKPESIAQRQASRPSVPTGNRAAVYTNISVLAALGEDARLDSMRETVGDGFSELISRWFGIAPPDYEGRMSQVANVGDPSLRAVLRSGIQRAEDVRAKGQEAVSVEVAALVEALERVAERLKRHNTIDALFGNEQGQ